MRIVSAVVFLLPALIITTPRGAGLVELAVLIGIFCCGKSMWAQRHALFGPARLIVLALLASLVLAVASMALTGFEARFLEAPCVQMLAVGLIGLAGLARPNAAAFWPGVFTGAIGAAAIAAYQRFGLEVPRAEGFHMAIVFGDIAMALGLMALASIERFVGTRWVLLPYAAFLGGAAASVLSGSRGGWIALLFSFLPLYAYGKPAMKRGVKAIVAVSAALFLVGYFVPETNIRQRVAEAVNDVAEYHADGQAATSVGARLEMWKAAWMLFREHPVTGTGRANFHRSLNDLADAGKISDAVRPFRHAHNEMLNALATGGVVGGLALAFLYAAPMAFFVRCLRRDGASRPYALAGLLLVLSFIDFGLTQVMFAHHVSAAFYALTVCLLAGLCIMLEHAGTDTDTRSEARHAQPMDA
jgi:O-antigen ligase